MISSYHRPEQFITSLGNYNLKRKNENENEINAVKRMRTVHQQNVENYAANNLLTPPQTPTAVSRARTQQPPSVARALQPPAVARTLQPPKPNLIISNPVQFEQYSLAHDVQV